MRDPDPRIRTVEHESAKGSWRMQFMHPRPDTAPLVDRFCAYSECNTEFHRRREPPARLATLLFNLGPELRVELADGSRGTYGAGDAFFAGPSETYAITETDCAQRGVQVSLTPLGARRLLGFPLYEVRDRLIDPTEFFGQSARRTMERLREADAPERRLAIIEQEMELALARPSRPVACDLVWAMRAPSRVIGTNRHRGAGRGVGVQPQTSFCSIQARVRHDAETIRARLALRLGPTWAAKRRGLGLGGTGGRLRLLGSSAFVSRFHCLCRQPAGGLLAARVARRRRVRRLIGVVTIIQYVHPSTR
jgi:hypothetical protein